MSLWLAKDYLKKALNRWDIDGREWVNEAIIAIGKEEERIKELEVWIADLQSGLYINCVYCGHRYPPGIPSVRDKVLYEHIKKCEKHPLLKALEQIKELEAALRHIDNVVSACGYKCGSLPKFIEQALKGGD